MSCEEKSSTSLVRVLQQQPKLRTSDPLSICAINFRGVAYRTEDRARERIALLTLDLLYILMVYAVWPKARYGSIG